MILVVIQSGLTECHVMIYMRAHHNPSDVYVLSSSVGLY